MPLASMQTAIERGIYFYFDIGMFMGFSYFASHLSKAFITLVWDLMVSFAMLRSLASLPC